MTTPEPRLLSRDAVLAALNIERFYASRLGSPLLPAGTRHWKTLCPFHPDTDPSLSIERATGLFHCFGCKVSGSVFDFEMRRTGVDFPEALRQLAEESGIASGQEEPKRRVSAVYRWLDPDGNLIFERLRYEPKTFRVRRPDGNGDWHWDLQGVPSMLYHADILAATELSEPVLLTEGEHDSDVGLQLGLLSTTSGGVTSWKPELAEQLRGRTVWIPPHNDAQGEHFAQSLAASLHGVAASVRILRLPGLRDKGADLADWVAQGHTKEELLALAEATPEWQLGLGRHTKEEAVEHGTTAAAPWPEPLAPAAFHGLAGDFVRAIEPHTEADPVALLISYFVAVGSVVGRGPHFVADAAKHYTNLNAVLVGQTARGRKGSSWAQVRRPFETVDADWARGRIQYGLSSGEGLIWAVRDLIEKQEPLREKSRVVGYQTVVEDPGVDDKRLLIVEQEFAATLRVMGRDGSTLSPTIRQAWDTGDLRILTKNSPAKATGAHISIIGHITGDEVLRYLDSTEAGNGFANRFLWACVRRSKLLPEGGRIHEVDFGPFVRALKSAVEYARGVTEMKRDDEARELWRQVYPTLSADVPGLVGAMIARSEAQTLRLACLYALLDQSATVRREHLEAALALWGYCEASARFIFGDTLGDPVADEILRVLRQTEDGLTRTEISKHFGRNRAASDISRALARLLQEGFATCLPDAPTGGRPAERWCAARTRQQAYPQTTKETNETK